MLTYQDVFLGFSVLTNAYLIYKTYQQKKRRPLSRSAQELLHDLSKPGGAVLHVEVIDQSAIFLRSPRDIK